MIFSQNLTISPSISCNPATARSAARCRFFG
jgi:hypothetical protein